MDTPRPVKLAATIVYPPAHTQVGMQGPELDAASTVDARQAFDTASDVAYQLIKRAVDQHSPIDRMELQRIPGRPDFVVVTGKAGASGAAVQQALEAIPQLADIRFI